MKPISKSSHYVMMGALTLAAGVALSAITASAGDIPWQGTTASYNTPANWVGGVIPGLNDNAINDNTTNNVVQINSGDPDWTLEQLRAGNGAGDGAFVQNGANLLLLGTNFNHSVITAYTTPLRLGLAAADTGIFTLNAGTINYSNGSFNIGELGTGILNLGGGSITGSGNMSVNWGSIGTPTAVTATAGNGFREGDYTWFEQGYYAVDTSLGLPAAGSTIASVTQADHSYAFAPSYTASNAYLVSVGVPNTTITPATPPVPCSGLSILASAGNGPTVVNYVIHHADSTTETGSISVPDWFSATGQEVVGIGARVDALGINFQTPGNVAPNTGNAPYLWSLDITVTNAASAVTSVDLTYASGGVACVMGMSSQSTGGGAFTPLALTGFNADVVVEAGAVSRVSSFITDTVNHTNGAINITGGGQLFVGNGGVGVYNLKGGSIDVHNYIAIGRSGGNGTFNMTGGSMNQDSAGQNLLVGTGFQAPTGGSAVGVLNMSGGTINCQGSLLIPENAPSTGTFNMSGTAVVNMTNWIAIGRNSANGYLNLTNGSITFWGGPGNLDIGAGGPGVLTQVGGTITNLTVGTWIGESSDATWTISGGSAILGQVLIAETGTGHGTLNLNGGLFRATGINCTTGGYSLLDFNGGILQAGSNNVNFISGLVAAQVDVGGAIIDSQAFNLTVPQPLVDVAGGGLTKLGSGTLSLTGANGYTGATIVGAGTLGLTTASTGTGSCTVSNGARLNVQVVGAADTSYSPANATFLGTATTLGIDLNGLNPTANAPLNVTGTLTVSGTVTVNFLDAAPALGTFPLIHYGTLSGVGTSFVLGSLPLGLAATLVNNTAGHSIDLHVTQALPAPRWNGAQAGGIWDINTTPNWVNLATLAPTAYVDPMTVLFNDLASQPTVTLNTTVTPGGVIFTNDALPYTLLGTGVIAGTNGLVKQGASTLSILNTGGNTYTGATVISGGTLTVTNLANGGSPSPIGASTSDTTNLVLAGGTFAYAGAPISVNRGYSVTAGGSTIDTESNLTLSGTVDGPAGNLTFNKTGPATLTYTGVSRTNALTQNLAGATYLIKAGTVVLDGSAGNQTNVVRNLNLGSDPGVDVSLILTNTTLVTRTLQLGNNVSCTGTLIMNSNSTMTLAANNFAVGLSPNAGTPSTGILTQNPGSVVDSSAELWVAQGPAATGIYNMNGGTAIFRNWVAIGRNGGLSATFNMTGGTVTKTANNNFMVGSRDGTTGTVGTLNMSGGNIFCGSEFWIGEAQNNASAALGTANISGTANLIVSNWIAIGREGAIGVLNLSGGSVTKLGTTGNNIEIGNGTGSTGTINQTGGVFNNTISETRVGTGAPGIWNMSGGTANLGGLVFCNNSGCTNGTLNLNGGVITAREVRANQTGVANVSTLNWNGGTIAAGSGANTNFIHNLTRAIVLSGGAIIDSGTNAVSVSQALLDGTTGGGLTKIGSGTLRLNGTNTYTGTTLVNVGTLGGIGVIASPVTVASGAALAPGVSIGTLTISNSLTLSAGSSVVAEVSLAGGVASNDRVVGLTSVNYGGTLVVTNVGSGPLLPGTVFKLFTATAPSGNFTAVTFLPAGGGVFDPATGEVTVTNSGVVVLNQAATSGGNLILTGSGLTSGGGYTVLTTTNVATPLSSWTTNSAGTMNASGLFTNTIPLNGSEPERFFLIRVP